MPAILKGLLEKIENGPLTGSYARDIRVFVFVLKHSLRPSRKQVQRLWSQFMT